MFKLADKNKAYQRVVQIQVPSDGGKTSAESFTAHFKLLPVSELQSLLKRKRITDRELIGAVLVGWEHIQDSDGTPLEFGKENLNRLCDIAYWSRAVFNDYMDFAAGLPAKN